MDLSRWCIRIAWLKIHELIKFFPEGEFDGTGRTIPLLGDDDLDRVRIFRFFVVVIIAVQESDDIGILLDRSGFPDIGHHRPFVLPALHSP